MRHFYKKLGLSLGLAALSSSTAWAADSTCPATSATVHLATLDGIKPSMTGANNVCLGVQIVYGAPFLVGYTQRSGGGFDSWFVVDTKGAVLSKLSRSSNFCLGGGNDNLTIEDGNHTGVCATLGLLPFAYNGWGLYTYGEAGSDHIHGGAGKDMLYGGAGSDNLWSGYFGKDEYLFGESGNDTLEGSQGSGSVLFGGIGADSLSDGGGGGTYFVGEADNDYIDATSCNDASVDCGPGADTLDRGGPNAAPMSSCETVRNFLVCN
jgi:Ca2+-binding RTX toxin-like protein